MSAGGVEPSGSTLAGTVPNGTLAGTVPDRVVAHDDSALVGRAEVLAALDDLVSDVRKGVGRAVLLRGEPGIGKSALLAHVVSNAEGAMLLQVRGVESEAGLAYAGLFDLCRPLLHRLDSLPKYQATSLRRALALDEPTGQDRFAAAAGFLALLSAAASDVPILVVVDDVQWLDTPTVEAIGFVARRLRSEPVTFVMASRPRPQRPDHLDDVDQVTLGGLTTGASSRLLDRSATSPVAPAVRDSLAVLCDGNPLALIQVAEMLTPGQLAGIEPLPVPLPVGPRLGEVFEHGFAGLTHEAIRSLGIAALWQGQVSELTRTGVAGFDSDALQEAVDAGLITVSMDQVVFRHGLARAFAVHSVPEVERRAIHTELAELVAGDPERRAWHLAEAADGPDLATSEALALAARLAAGRGGLTAAADLFERAASLAPAGTGQDFLVDAVVAARNSGAAKRAAHLCAQGDSLVTDPVARGRLVHQRGRLALDGTIPIAEGMALLEAEFDRMVLLDTELAVRIGVDACMMAVVTGKRSAVRRLGNQCSDVAAGCGPGIQRLAEFVQRAALAFDDEATEDRFLVDGHADLMAVHPHLDDVKTATELAMTALGVMERYGAARQLGDRFCSWARTRGAVGALPLSLALAAKSALYCDDWVSARTLGTEAVQLADESGQVFAGHYAATWLTVLAALRGEEGEVARQAAGCMARNTQLGTSPGGSVVSHAFGLLALGHQRYGEAVAHFTEVARLRQAQGATSNGLLHWEADYAEALIREGHPDLAEPLVRRIEDRAADSRSPWSSVVSERCRGLMASPADLDRHFARSVEACTPGTLPFERLRTEWCWGERLLAVGRRDDAVAHLRLTAAGFRGFGAAPWAAGAEDALERAGSPAVRPGTATSVHPVPDLDLELRGPATTPDPAVPGRKDPASCTVVTLGDFAVRSPDGEVRLSGHIGRALGFVISRGPSVHVEELVDALWPDTTADISRARLRNILSRSRRMVGPILLREGDCIRLSHQVHLDVANFEEQADIALGLSSGDLTAAADAAHLALAQYGGEYLPTNRYDDWAAAPRERIERQRLALLELLASDAEQRGETDEMLAYLERAIRADPYDEERYLRGAKALVALGRHARAVLMIERADAIAEELGVALAPDTVGLKQQLLSSMAPDAPST
ncbi:MAG TPA: AAA family ATPase [Acidimicrobiales bacterium]|nr:AAA family ATPase [Acidimicrobiales bacterium]